ESSCRSWLFGRNPIANLIAGLGGYIYKPDACTFFRFREPHNLRGNLDARPRAGQLKSYAWEAAVIYYKGASRGNCHARRTYIEDHATIGTAEFDVRARGWSGSRMKSAVARGMNRLNWRWVFGVGCGRFPFRLCRYTRVLARLIPPRDFYECCQLATCL